MAAKESDLFWFILIVATIVFVAVEGLLIYSIVRFRERPGAPAPRQIHGNNTLEIIWTIAPSVFLFVVLIGTIYTMFNLSNVSGTGRPVTVKVVGHQWWWEFDYVNEGIVTADEMDIPVGAVVNVSLESTNVIHSFWIPQITGKTDVVPGHNNTKVFRADTIGTYRGLCTEYCGLQHAHMDFFVKVVSQDQYNTWVTAQQQAAAKAVTDPTAKAGLQLFRGAGTCQGCHGIVGVNLKSFNDPLANALIGPNLTHFGSRRTIAGGVLTWDPATCQVVTGSDGKPIIQNEQQCGLYQWLHDPQGVKPGNDMKIPTLTDTQIAQLVAYLESLT